MSRIAALLVGLLFAAPRPAESADPPPSEDKEKQKASLRRQLDDWMGARKWDEASAVIRRLQALSTAEEKRELERISIRLSGEKDWEKIEKEDPSQPRNLLARTEAFIKKHGKDPELRARGEELRKKALGEIYHTIEDFEKEHDELDRDLVLIQEPSKVKQGKFAARWVSTKKGTDAVLFSAAVQDWTKFSHLVFWIHSEKPSGRLTIDAISAEDEDDYFEAWNNIDWTGWKEIRLALRGKESRFRKEGKPDWTNIQDLRLWKDKGSAVQIIIDDIRLERAP